MESKQLINKILVSDVYPQFVEQLQKDVNRAGIDYSIQNESPQALYYEIVFLMKEKLQNEFNQFLSLLYAIDVSEASVRNFISEDVSSIAEYTTYLVFKREWEKVCYRNGIKVE